MQEEILELLKEQRRPLSRGEIAELLNENVKKISMRIAQLIKFNEVKTLEIPRDLAFKMYHCRRRMRVYYVC